MIERTMKIELENGLEARPVAVLVQKASMHDSTIYIHAEGKKVNAKSIMGMMSLGLDMGEEVTVVAGKGHGYVSLLCNRNFVPITQKRSL